MTLASRSARIPEVTAKSRALEVGCCGPVLGGVGVVLFCDVLGDPVAQWGCSELFWGFVRMFLAVLWRCMSALGGYVVLWACYGLLLVCLIRYGAL
jgi:hypothetical protein